MVGPVVVIGGGIVGLSCAYALADRGRDVVVCEKASLGAGSTARAAGGIRTQFSTRINVELSLASLPTWEAFEEHFGVDIGFKQVGYLFLAREATTADRFEETVAMQQKAGASVDLLSPADAATHCPELHADRFRSATYAGRDGFADPYLALQGYADAARAAGVDIRTHTEVTAIDRTDAGIETVTIGTSGGTERLEPSAVINAAGPWASAIAALADMEIPVVPRRRQALVAAPETPIGETVPLTIDLDSGVYFRPEREGAAIVGGQFDADDPEADPDRYSESMDLDWAATAIERAADVAGYFGPKTQLKRGWAGLYAVTPDHHPIIEETEPGFVNAVGFSGHGFQHAPATGQVVAELLIDGEASTVDISGLSSDRFDRGEQLIERHVA
ncbi:NAD(P)/FAD-dependent oxidoreductase [Halalkalirubrum salinum]|uniref:NAD(P)/FAD-dependent oxidoreductase n=1 Tax=Halalkalirubrum salinum TaxID=2563889 RepID=UPI0010FAEE0B|nr:FAD-dependent oxidoreductase [Halalkalirubrum salinum]